MTKENTDRNQREGAANPSKTILLVEDQAIIALSQAAKLEKHGYTVETAYSGEKALERFGREPFDLVLMDIDLGRGIDGIETARRILDRHDVPIVFVTSHSEPSVVEEVKSVTRYGYVLKSLADHVLTEAIEMALELHDARQELKRSRNLYRSAADLTGDIIVRADHQGRWYFINREGERVWGIKLNEVYGEEFWHLVHPEDHQKTAEAIGWMMEHRKPVTGLVNRTRTVDGWRKYEWNASPIVDRRGNPDGFQATGRDVTEREAYQKNLRLKTHAIDSSANGIAFADRTFNITYANPAALALWGFESEAEVIGRSGREFLASDAPLEETLLKAVAGEPQVSEFTGVRSDGTPFDVEITVSGIREEGGEITALMAVLVDVSERKRQQREITELLAEKEVMIREFRHRVKNDLSLIRSLLRLQATYVADHETARSITEAAERLTVLTRVYDRIHEATDERRVSARAMIVELVKDLQASTISGQAAISLDVADLEVCDRGSISLGLIVNELVTNAVKYADGTGKPCQVHIRLGKSDTQGLNLSVSDDGPGYPQQIITGGGFGYGLTIVNELVKQHRGEVELKNLSGATVEITNLFARDLERSQPGCVA